MASSVNTCRRSILCSAFSLAKGAPQAEHTVLHNVADDAELIEVTASTLRAKWFLEGNLTLVRHGLNSQDPY
jgi:hypothetical protein